VAELAGLVVGLALFSWLHNLAGTDVASATANAQALQSVERTLHLDIELAANHWLVEHPVLMQAAVLYYRLYYLPLVGVLLWVLFRRAEVYPTVRRTLLVMAALALLIFWLVPMSPPRFAPEQDRGHRGRARPLRSRHLARSDHWSESLLGNAEPARRMVGAECLCRVVGTS